MPTVDGDVVIVHRQSVPAEYFVWLVIENGQQGRDEKLFQPMRVANQSAAEQLARAFVVTTGTVFLVDEDSRTWTTLPV